MSRRLALAAVTVLTAVLTVPGTGMAAAALPTCTDPFEEPRDLAELQPGVATERGFCAPDGSAGGGDLDRLSFSATGGHRYRIELVERGAGFEGAYFVIEEAYDAQTQTPQFTPESPYSKVTSPLPSGTLLLGVVAVGADNVRLTGDDLGYRVLVTDLGPAPADEPPADQPSPAVTSVVLGASRVRSGASTTASVVLDGPAPAGGTEVALRSSDARVGVPATVTVPAGEDRASVAVTTTASRSRYTATISASTASGGASAALQVR